MTLIEKIAKGLAHGDGWDGRINGSLASDSKPGPMTETRWQAYLEEAAKQARGCRIHKTAPH